MKKRALAFSIAICLLLTGAGARILYITLSGNYSVSDTYNSYAYTVDKVYTQILDRNSKCLTNCINEYVAIIRPNEKCMSELPLLFDKSQVKEITSELSKGYPVIRATDRYVNTKYIKIYTRTVRNSDDMLCKQLLDYTCSGLEQYVGNPVMERKIRFTVDAMGRVLAGDEGEIEDTYYDNPQNIKITINSEIQRIVENAAKPIKKGSVVVLDANTSELLATVSKPNDYFNRSISAYTIGSIFKIIVAASAIENGINPTFDCKGTVKISDMTYSCQKKHVHKKETIKEALANSCNCYFVNLALKLGKDKILKTAKEFGFGSTTTFYDNWTFSNGHLPSDTSLTTDGLIAMLGFGQGSLTDSPYHFALALAAIANGGIYKCVDLCGNKTSKEKRVISNETSKKLLEYMRYVVEKGTGYYADYKNKSAGKTATAQSGQFEDGKEILHTYFAGVFPYNKPKYVIVVMNEKGNSGSEDCCPIFRTIVEKLDNL